MHLILSYSDGRRTEAVVLAMTAERMRISIPGASDAIELRAEQELWISESGERVEIDAVLTASETGSQLADFRPLARSAGQRVS